MSAGPLVVGVVAGVRLELVAGVQYRASRPFVERGRRIYPVTIEPIGGLMLPADPVVVDGLELEAATALVNAFNDGPTSWEGRTWGASLAAAWRPGEPVPEGFERVGDAIFRIGRTWGPTGFPSLGPSSSRRRP